MVGQVNEQLTAMVGDKHAVETALGFAPTEPDRLLRALQLMIDGGKRGVAEASLGSANVLYLALKHLEHQYLVDEGELCSTRECLARFNPVRIECSRPRVSS